MGMVEEVKAYIMASSLAGNPWIDPAATPATGNLFQYFLPDGANIPDRACGLHQAEGRGEQRTLGNKVAWVRPRLTVVNRVAKTDGWPVAIQDSEAIRDLLQLVTDATLSGTYYLAIRPVGNPYQSGLDPSSRPLVTCHYDIDKYLS